MWFVDGIEDPKIRYGTFIFAVDHHRETHKECCPLSSPTISKKEVCISLDDNNDTNHSLHVKSYDVGCFLGSGAYGKVYKGKERHGEKRQVAIKVIKNTYHPKKSPTSIREFKLNSSLVHPNILQMYDVFKDPVNIYYILEYSKGVNL